MESIKGEKVTVVEFFLPFRMNFMVICNQAEISYYDSSHGGAIYLFLYIFIYVSSTLIYVRFSFKSLKICNY